MRLPIDTTAVRFVAAEPPEAATDFDTKAPKLDDEGRPVYNVHLFAVGAGGRDVITVKVPGEPKGIGEFSAVTVRELVATTWAMGDRFGVSFKAAGVEAKPAPRAAS